MKCKHEQLDIGYEFPIKRCLDCGETLPLGPAAVDTDAVRVEKRAAEMAASRIDRGEGWGPDRFEFCPETLSDELCATCEAHYLASAIVNQRTHGEGQS